MAQATISGLRGVELAVHDLKQSTEFYRQVWGLEPVSSLGDTVHLRGTGREHHAVTLRERPRAALLAVNFEASNRQTVDALYARAKAMGANIESAPAQLGADAGGGYAYVALFYHKKRLYHVEGKAFAAGGQA